MGRIQAKLTVAAACLCAGLAAPPVAEANDPYVVGGAPASTAQYPWQTAVVVAGGGSANGRMFCGGDLLTSRIVLTAAHCVYNTDPDCTTAATCLISDPGGDGTKRIDPNDVDAVLGRTTLSSSDGAEIPVQQVSYRASYSAVTGRDDVGYLVLSGATGQAPIKIAGPDERAVWAPGLPAEISGWGSTLGCAEPCPIAISDTLRAATVQIFDDGTCAADYPGEIDTASMLCAGAPGGGTDTCYGDSGGPLQSPLDGGGYRLVGLTSFGDGCAQAGSPGVYTRIAEDGLRGAIVSDVFALETANGLAHEGIVGSGGRPRSSTPASTTPAANKKCAKHRSKKSKKNKKKKKKRGCKKKHKKGKGKKPKHKKPKHKKP